jgi:hypothetical protein
MDYILKFSKEFHNVAGDGLYLLRMRNGVLYSMAPQAALWSVMANEKC